MKNSDDDLKKTNFGEFQVQDSEANRRYTNATIFKKKTKEDAISLNFDSQTIDNQSHTFQNSRELGSFFAAQSVAMSPSR
jgi:hypothetical protein